MDREILDVYSDYLIVQNKYATSTGLSSMLDGEISHDKVARFLRNNQFCSKDLWEYIKPQIKKMDHAQGILIIDDFIEEKPYTDENEIIAWHYSHTKHQILKGINIVSAMIRYGDTAFPIGYEPVHKDLKIEILGSKKIKRKASVSKNEHFRNMFDQAIKNDIKFEYNLSDVWFGSKENMRHVDKKGKKFI